MGRSSTRCRAAYHIGVPLSLWDGLLEVCEWALLQDDWKDLSAGACSCLPSLDVGAVDVSLSVACQDASHRFFHRFAISSRQRPELTDNQSVIEGEELKTDLAGNVETSFPPALNRYVARPIASGRGDHSQDRLFMSPIEVCR